MRQARNYVSEESAKSRQLLHGLRLQLQTSSCRVPSASELDSSVSTWQIATLEHTKVKLNACKDRMDNMDAG